MRLLSAFAAGRLVDRVGERAALLAGLTVVAVSSLLAGLSATYPQLLVLRGVGGIGSAVFTIAATSLLLRLATSAQRGRTQSVYRSGFLIGGIVGPGFGGAVLGISLRAPFFLYAGTLLLAAVAAATLLPRAQTLERPRDSDIGRSLVPYLARRGVAQPRLPSSARRQLRHRLQRARRAQPRAAAADRRRARAGEGLGRRGVRGRRTRADGAAAARRQGCGRPGSATDAGRRIGAVRARSGGAGARDRTDLAAAVDRGVRRGRRAYRCRPGRDRR